MTICHIGWAASAHTVRWAKWFAQRGHECHLISDTPAEIEGVTVHTIPSYIHDPRPRWERLREFSIHDRRIFRINWVRRLVRELHPDIVHTHSLWYPGYLGVYAGVRPYVVTVFDGDILWRPVNQSLFHRLRTYYALWRADLVTGVSEDLVRGCRRLGTRPQKTHVIRRGVDLSVFKCNRARENVRHELGLPTNVRIVLSPRSLGKMYNIDQIIRAIPQIVASIPDVLFVFIWSGSDSNMEQQLRRLAQDLGVWKAVRFVGRVQHHQAALYHRAADVMVSVASTESGPVALMEAMACGDAPVISDLPCVREWITDSWNGSLVDPDDVNQIAAAIKNLLDDDEKRASFAERNQVLIHERGDENMWMRRMEELYQILLSGRP